MGEEIWEEEQLALPHLSRLDPFRICSSDITRWVCNDVI